MPEAPEVETERLHEAIHEELEREGGNLVRQVALTTAILAAIAAIASLLAGSTVNEALVLKNEATTLQAQASDQWAYYQAKGIKASVQDATIAAWTAAGKAAPADALKTKARYAEEQQEIARKAKELEHERDAKSAEADHLLHRHHAFAAAVALFQVAIALGAVAALTRIRVVWLLSLLVGIGGAISFAWPYAR
jgi:aminopeptidase N